MVRSPAPPPAGLRRAATHARARRSRVRARIGAAGLLASIGLGLPASVRAESEDEVKAAFLFHFARYVEWPPTAFESDSAAIHLCLIGEPGFEGVLAKAVAGRKIGARPVAVASVASLDDAMRCHLLFLGEHADMKASVVEESLGDRAVFTISDETGFAEAGGIANFVLVEQKIRFEINQKAARRAGLKVSSSLLRLAKLVGGDR